MTSSQEPDNTNLKHIANSTCTQTCRIKRFVSHNKFVVHPKLNSTHLLHTILIEANDTFCSIDISVASGAKECAVYKVDVDRPQEQYGLWGNVEVFLLWYFYLFIYFYSILLSLNLPS